VPCSEATLLHLRRGVPPLAGGASREVGRAHRRLLQSGVRPGRDDLSARSTRRSPTAGSTAFVEVSGADACRSLPPRARDSYWSAVNTERFRELQKLGKVAAAGLRAFEARDAKRTREYSFERARPAAFDRECESALRANRAAADFFDAQPPGYRKGATYWVMSAKKEETRKSRLAIVIGRAARGLRIDRLKPNTP
jgi:hypothetical protein